MFTLVLFKEPKGWKFSHWKVGQKRALFESQWNAPKSGNKKNVLILNFSFWSSNVWTSNGIPYIELEVFEDLSQSLSFVNVKV